MFIRVIFSSRVVSREQSSSYLDCNFSDGVPGISSQSHLYIGVKSNDEILIHLSA